jgi:shikimate kinase
VIPVPEGEDLAATLARRGNLAILGFMAAGKTRVGRELARATGLGFVDVDEEIERRVGLPVHRIFETRGEPFFREAESAALRELCGRTGVILACGGGTVLREQNRSLLREHCVRIWLRASRTEILARLARPSAPRRPLLEGQDVPVLVDALLREREPYYQECDLTVETDGRGPVEIAREIARRLRLPVDADHRG